MTKQDVQKLLYWIMVVSTTNLFHVEFVNLVSFQN